jgi:hypothetical protein
LVGVKKEERMTMEQFLQEFKDTIDQLDVMDIKIPEDLIILMILHSLPREYQFFVHTQTGKDILPIFQQIEFKLLDEEMQVKMDAEKEGAGEALYMKKGSSNGQTQSNSSTARGSSSSNSRGAGHNPRGGRGCGCSYYHEARRDTRYESS